MSSTSNEITATSVELAQITLKANQALQQHLTERAAALEDEIREAERLLKLLETDDAYEDPEDEIQIPGAAKPTGFFLPSEYLEVGSPLRADSLNRNNYAARIMPHTMNPKELDALKSAVMAENRKVQACRRQTNDPSPVDLERDVDDINWDIVAELVSDASAVKFTAEECRIKWVGDRHPSINHSEWSATETEELRLLVDELKKKDPTAKLDWVDIAKQLGTNRTPVDVMSKSKNHIRHQWDSYSDEKLLEGVEMYGINSWNSVARHVSPHATPTQCQNRYQKSLDPNIKRRGWAPEEDERLRKTVAALGSSWVKVAEFIPGRTNDQCNERWTEGLNSSSSKNIWSEREDALLVELAVSMNRQWKSISLKIGNGKTGPSCRARYNKLSATSTRTTPGTSARPTPEIPPSAASTSAATPPATSEQVAFAEQASAVSVSQLESEPEPDTSARAGATTRAKGKRKRAPNESDIQPRKSKRLKAAEHKNSETTAANSAAAETVSSEAPGSPHTRPRPRLRNVNRQTKPS
ncbi:hypothetical protein FA15DRAFT_666783 [Coprinopsis marcescibilis]|uniref:Uncharacterized protein n=1 Tax=Coprinopsis marcescibilis TaxID=230819 RepID=A0A5C3LEY8_COPMA|nr:hypothetical protein FA15DRAFT_666783 [Coprinopsis marcescibilis]